jgi:hypothetical protein
VYYFILFLLENYKLKLDLLFILLTPRMKNYGFVHGALVQIGLTYKNLRICG